MSTKPCRRCGGVKEPGRAVYCDECRRVRVIADSSASHESERGRRRHLAAMAAREGAAVPPRRRVVGAPEGQKWCARCQAFRSIGSFGRSGERAAAYCIPCQRAYSQERRLKIHYNITWDEYDLLLASQDHRCAICKGKPRKTALAVDHDHNTGEIRGLLCSKCNHRLLGGADESAERLRQAADYLVAFTPREVFGESRYVPGYSGGEA